MGHIKFQRNKISPQIINIESKRAILEILHTKKQNLLMKINKEIEELDEIIYQINDQIVQDCLNAYNSAVKKDGLF